MVFRVRYIGVYGEVHWCLWLGTLVFMFWDCSIDFKGEVHGCVGLIKLNLWFGEGVEQGGLIR